MFTSSQVVGKALLAIEFSPSLNYCLYALLAADDNGAGSIAGASVDGSDIFRGVFKAHLRLSENRKLRKQCRSLQRLLNLATRKSEKKIAGPVPMLKQ